MTTEPDGLDLAELADEAGVTPRTIRYYVQQGLLPSPGKRGPGARYDRALLERLQLIKHLQRQHLPLSEIRHQLETLDDEGVERALQNSPVHPQSESALGYVRSVLGKDEMPAALRESSRGAYGEADREPERPPTKRQLTKSTWERVRLSRDVELNVRRPLTREQNKLVDRLLDAARNIFSEES